MKAIQELTESAAAIARAHSIAAEHSCPVYVYRRRNWDGTYTYAALRLRSEDQTDTLVETVNPRIAR